MDKTLSKEGLMQKLKKKLERVKSLQELVKKHEVEIARIKKFLEVVED